MSIGASPVLSVVVPVRNEAENVLPLLTEIAAALNGRFPFEIIYVDDGSTDDTYARLQAAQEQFPTLKIVRHRHSYGQSTAIVSAVQRAEAPLIAMLDGDGQNDPADIPALYDRWQAHPDRERLLIAGWRANRQDTSSRRWASRVANWVRSALLHDHTPDSGCGSKLFPRALFLDLPRFDHMHRFLPALVLRAGGAVESVVVNHRPRGGGVSNYTNLRRGLEGIPDLLGVMWLIRRGKVPEYLP